MKDYYDHNLARRDLQEGDLVWVHNPQRKKGVTPKLIRYWKEAFVITKKTNDLVL